MPQYRFDVDANTKKAEQNIKQLLGLLGKVDKASSNSSNVDNYRNDSKTLDLLKEYKKIEESYKNMSRSAQDYQKASDFKGNDTSFQKLNDSLGNTSSLLSKVSQGINSLGKGGGGSLKQHAKDAEILKTNLGDAAKTIQILQREKAYVRRTGNQQARIAGKVESTGYMSYSNLGTYTRNQAQIKNMDSLHETINGLIHQQQDQYEKLRGSIVSGLNTEGKPMTKDELNSAHEQMGDVGKVLHKARDLNTAIEATQDSGTMADSAISGSLKMIGGKATSLLVGVELAKEAGKAFINAVKEGEKTNSSTGEEALNIGNVSGHMSDQTVRGNVQNIMWNNGLGYNTQQGLDYLSLAQQRKSFDSDYRHGRGNSESESMVNAFEYGGRSTGISDKSWQSVAGTAMDNGGILSDRDIYKLSHTIAGENNRSGNSGNPEENAKIITSTIQQLSRTTALTSGGIQNIAAVQAALGRSDRSFTGKRLDNVMHGLNQGFQNAAQGQDPSLMYTLIASNPNQFGGLAGYVRAQIQASEGTSNLQNINVMRNYARKLGKTGGENGEALATLFMEQHFGLSPKDAQKFVQHSEDDSYSLETLQKEVSKQKKSGTKQTKKNNRSYRNSEQAGYNTQQAQGEAINSGAAGMTKWFRDAKNNVGKGMNDIWRGITDPFNSDKAKGALSAYTKMYHPLSRIPGVADIGKLGFEFSSWVGQTGKLLSGQKVKAATVSKKDKSYFDKKKDDKKKTGKHRASENASKKVSRGAASHSSGKTIEEKEQEQSRSKQFLNTRDEEKNLRTEKNNIDLRESTLSTFARLLKEEKGLSKNGGLGKAGTVGNGKHHKGNDDDDDKKKKKNKSSKSKTSKSKTSSSAKKKHKSTSSHKKSSSKTVHNTNNININMPATNGTPAAIGNEIGTRVATKIAQYSRDMIREE